MAKEKNMCKWKKDEIKKDFEDYVKIVKEPAYVCCKCGRVADKKKLLCKAEKIGNC